jgi:hypothetical protein
VFAHVNDVARTAQRELGGLDTWVLAAAAAVDKFIQRITPAELAQIVVAGPGRPGVRAMAAIPIYEAARRRAVIHISSVEADAGMPRAACGGGGARRRGMLDSLRIELKRQGAPIAITNGHPPVYDPGRGGQGDVRSRCTRGREVIVGAGGKALIALRRALPAAREALLTGDRAAPKRLTVVETTPDENRSSIAPNATSRRPVLS